MATFSFMDVTASLAGATGVVDLGFGSSVTKEGITVTASGPRNTMTPGADGEVMHSLKADKSGTVTVRLLYTSPVNATLQTMFNAQSLSSSAWGNNVITIRNKGNNEIIMCRSAAFQKLPDRTFAEEGQMVEWVFDCGKIDVITGSY
jgi:hypothetical protein